MRHMLALCMGLGLLAPHCAGAEQALLIKPLAEKNVAQLPAGQLFWRIENFRPFWCWMGRKSSKRLMESCASKRVTPIRGMVLIRRCKS